MAPRTYMPRRGKGTYGYLILLLVVIGAALQWNWMQRVRRDGAESVVTHSFAEKLSRWMLAKRGIHLEEDAAAGESGTERILCETCGGSGQMLGPDGAIVPCPICPGVGSGLVRKFSPDENICPFCVGMGRAFLPGTREVVICPRCNGRGLIGPAAAPDAPPAE